MKDEINFTVFFYFFLFKLFHDGHTIVFYTINYHYMLDISYSYHMMSETTSTSTVDFCCAMVVNDGYVLAMNLWPITNDTGLSDLIEEALAEYGTVEIVVGIAIVSASERFVVK
jgi:hypothetical protein